MRRPLRETTPPAAAFVADPDADADAATAATKRLEAMVDRRFGRVQVDAPDGTIWSCNTTFAKMLGVETADLLGRRLADLIAAPCEGAWPEIVAAAASEPEVSRIIPVRHADGRRLQLRIQLGSADAADGNPQAVLLIEDVTAEAKARASLEDKLRSLELAIRGSRDETEKIARFPSTSGSPIDKPPGKFAPTSAAAVGAPCRGTGWPAPGS